MNLSGLEASNETRAHVSCRCLALLAQARVRRHAQVSVTATTAYAEGRFGETQTTEVFGVAPAVEYLRGHWSAAFRSHYHVRGPENVISGIGRVENRRRAFGDESGRVIRAVLRYA